MGYQIQLVNKQLETPDIVLGVDGVFSNDDVFKPLYSTMDQAVANLKSLLLTRKGERYEQVTYGTNLLNRLFEPIYQELKTDIQDDIFSAINYWLPYLTIETLEILTNEDDPTLEHTIKITLSVSISGFETKTITLLAGENGTLEIE